MRLIFGLFLDGLTPYAIAKELTRRGILTVTGQSKWNQATINSFLRNEVRQDDTNLGRRPMQKPQGYEEAFVKWTAKELSARKAAELLGVSTPTFLKWVKESAHEQA